MSAPDAVTITSLVIASARNALDAALRTRDPGTRDVLEAARRSLRSGSPGAALRLVDRAWRRYPDDRDLVAPAFGRLLYLDGRDYPAALRLLSRPGDPDPDAAALAVCALLELQQWDEASERLESALHRYCVAPGSLLEQVASRALAEPGIDAAGWTAVGPGLELRGELRDAGRHPSLLIEEQSGAVHSLRVRAAARHGQRPFHWTPASGSGGATLRISSGDAPLLAGHVRYPPAFGLDGRCTLQGNTLSGWARLRWSPTLRPRIRIEDEAGKGAWITVDRVPQPGSRWPFRLSLRRAGIGGARIQVSAQMPDGALQPLPDSPLLISQAARPRGTGGRMPARWVAVPPGRARRLAPASRASRAIDIIIPAYRGVDETLSCIESALDTAMAGTHVVVVDDASEEAALKSALDAMAAAGHITLLRNDTNRGFVESVNRGMSLHTDRDVVLLNSDAVVFGDWLERLRAAAYSRPKVGSVTPFSNSGSIASYPGAVTRDAIRPEAAAHLHALAAAANPGVTVDIPVGVGFCLYLRRDCLREVGALDAATFGKGYGEETDFCLRARRNGWSHLLAADVFVYHAGGQSFGERRAALLERSQRLINLRYPGYDRYIASYESADPPFAQRRRLDELRLRSADGPFVLVVTHALAGGVERYVTDRCREIRARGRQPLVLRPADVGSFGRCQLYADGMDVPNLVYSIPGESGALLALLRALAVDAVEIQHFLHFDAALIEALRSFGPPYDVFVHDYAWICPRVTLIGGTGRYCGEPAIAGCNACVRRNGTNLDERISTTTLRERSAKWLRGARRVVVPSPDAAARLRRYFPWRAVEVLPNSAGSFPFHRLWPARPDGIVRVAVIGAIGRHKGYAVLLACARHARARRLPIEFIVIGYTENDAPLLATGKVFITGRYSEGEAQPLLRREKPDVAWLPSVWPETWSYTLDEALRTGIPVVAFDIGAIAERLRSIGRGALLPLNCEPAQITEEIMKTVREEALLNGRQDAMIFK